MVAGQVCRWVEEGVAADGTERVRLVTPMCGWANKSLFRFSFKQCVVKTKTAVMREGEGLDSPIIQLREGEALRPLLVQGELCQCLAEGSAVGDGGEVARLQVVTQGGTVGWVSAAFFHQS